MFKIFPLFAVKNKKKPDSLQEAELKQKVKAQTKNNQKEKQQKDIFGEMERLFFPSNCPNIEP